jgi:hypothetical protein
MGFFLLVVRTIRSFLVPWYQADIVWGEPAVNVDEKKPRTEAINHQNQNKKFLIEERK